MADWYLIPMVRKMAYLPIRIASSGNSAADTVFWPHHTHLCSENFAECDFANFIEYRISKRNLKPTAFSSVQKALKQTAEHLKQNER